MEVRKIGRVRLAAALGLQSSSIIAQWRTGNTLPTAARAKVVAEVLEWPRLYQIAEAARIGTCARPSCGKTFINEGGGPRVYCSDRCRTIMQGVDGVESGRRDRDTLYRDREELRGAVRAMCLRCEPKGLCQDEGCPLRPVSPLPLLELLARPTTTATPYDREAGLRAAQAAARRHLQERWHGEHGEENRRRQSEQTAARWAQRRRVDDPE